MLDTQQNVGKRGGASRPTIKEKSMKARIVKDRKAGQGFTLMLPQMFKWRRQRMYACWFATKEEAARYLASHYMH